MNDFLKMDIFFVVATIGVVVITVLICIALWYLIRTLRAFERIATLAEEEAKLVRNDLDEARQELKREGRMLKHFVTPLLKFLDRHS